MRFLWKFSHFSMPNKLGGFDFPCKASKNNNFRISRVCRDFQRISGDSMLWREFCQKNFPFSSPDKYGKNWKYCFAARSQIRKGWEGGKSGDFEVVTLRSVFLLIPFFKTNFHNKF